MSYIINSIKGNEKYKTGLDILEDVIKDLEKTHGPKKSMKLLHSGSGSFNKVIINEVIFDDGKLCNLATRESKVPVYRKVLKDAGPSVNIAQKFEELKPSEQKDLITFIPFEDKDKIKFTAKSAATYKKDTKDRNTGSSTYKKISKKLDEIIILEKLTYKNWKAAAADGICPVIYAYKYIEKETHNGINLHICSISEGYESDLDSFYSNKYNKLSDQDKFFYDTTIRMQLSNLFERMSNNLAMLCNDIKPLNTVINSNPSNVDVKLIDFDSDYCQINEKHSKDKKHLHALMMQIIFANFFYKDYNKNNIFAEYLNQIKPHLDNNYKKMEIIFSDKYENDFFHTGKHYFKHLHKPGGKPEELWKKLYDNAFKDMIRKTVVIQPLVSQSSNQVQSQVKTQPKPKIKILKPQVVAAKEKALEWRDRLRTRKMSPKIILNKTRKKRGETTLQYNKRKARKYARENFGLNV